MDNHALSKIVNAAAAKALPEPSVPLHTPLAEFQTQPSSARIERLLGFEPTRNRRSPVC